MGEKMRTMRIPAEAQIRGIQKALANPKTPAQLRPSLEKRFNKLYKGMNTDARIHAFGESAPGSFGD